MISVLSQDYLNEASTRFELCGLSGDAKPTAAFAGNTIANGSFFVEMDTGSVFFFDASSHTWVLFGGAS
ncbi:MAG: hypothetical protein Q4D42_05105 [Eubacteriales bacterium]|nr:hypothetical protein [Eubacteriales bacterium]